MKRNLIKKINIDDTDTSIPQDGQFATTSENVFVQEDNEISLVDSSNSILLPIISIDPSTPCSSPPMINDLFPTETLTENISNEMKNDFAENKVFDSSNNSEIQEKQKQLLDLQIEKTKLEIKEATLRIHHLENPQEPAYNYNLNVRRRKKCSIL